MFLSYFKQIGQTCHFTVFFHDLAYHTGGFKTCLYGHDVLNVRDLLRSGANSDLLMHEIQHALNNRAVNGIEAEKGSKQWGSMSMIGG